MQSLAQIVSGAARQSLQAQALLSHNLANADTTAFKADLYEAQSKYLEGGQFGSNLVAIEGQVGVDLSPGNIVSTGRELDIAVAGEGWMQVVSPAGEQVLSRRGDLRVDPNGRLLDGEGNQLVGDGGPIALPPFSSMAIASDGTISIVPLGEAPTAVVALERIALVNPAREDLAKGADGSIRYSGAADLQPAAEIRLAVGSLEQSNVNAVSAMVEMIELSREFESHIKVIKKTDELNTASANLMKVE